MIVLLLILLFSTSVFADTPDLISDPFGAGKQANDSTARTVRYVTTLNQTGAGSIQECLNATNSICIYRVCGISQFSQTLDWIGKNNIYIPGQLAPGGIAWQGNNITIASNDKGHLFENFNSDYNVMSNVTLDYGTNNNYDKSINSQCCDTFHIEGNESFTPEHNFFTNLTIVRGFDENIEKNSVTGFTLANSIIGFPTNGKGKHFGANEIDYSNTPDVSTFSSTSAYNLYVGAYRRNMEAKTEGVEYLGNVVLHPGASYPLISLRGGGRFDIFNSLFYGIALGGYPIRFIENTGAAATGPGGSGDPTIYISGNSYNNKKYQQQENFIQYFTTTNPPPTPHAEVPYIERNIRRYKRDARLGFTVDANIIAEHKVLDYVQTHAGASFRIDRVGQRRPITNGINSLAKSYINNMEGLVNYSTNLLQPQLVFDSCVDPYPDTDTDGMSDDWEDAFGLNVGVADHNGTDLSGGTKTNLECFASPICEQSLNTLYLNSSNENGTFVEDNSEYYLPSDLNSLIDETYGVVKTTSSEGYTVITDKERVFIAVRPTATGFKNVLSCPHRYEDTYTGDICLEMFKESDKIDAVIINTTHRYDCANPTNCDDSSGTTPSGCERICDTARNPDSIFHHFVRYYLQNDFNMYQIHGFGAAENFTGINSKNGQTLNIILASSFSEEEIPSSVTSRLVALEAAFESEYVGQVTGSCYSTASDLCATVNVVNQDATINDAAKSNFINIEFKQNVRDEICSDTLDSVCPVTDAAGQTNRAKVIAALGLN